MAVRKSLLVSLALAAALAVGSAPTARAEVSIGIGGDTNWGIKTELTTNQTYPALGRTVDSKVTNTYSAHFLGIPIPVRAYIVHSFPYAPFSRPTMLADNAPLTSTSYAYAYDAYLGKNAWIISGSGDFWGSNTWYVRGSAPTDTRGATGYVHGGTGTGHSIDANARCYVKVV